jgi:hypothetical protein
MRVKMGGSLAAVMMMTFGSLAPVWAQTPAPAPAQAPAPAEEKAVEQPKPAEQKPKTLWDEFMLFSYAEMGYTFNFHGGSIGIPGSTASGATNLLREYDIYQNFTFDIVEFSIKRDPDEAFPFGEGLVLTAGEDSRKNHSIGILRSSSDTFPFNNTPWFDLQEAYISGRVPIGSGPVIKVGKFVTLLGYEVIESPNDLNYSRGYLFTFAIPLTTTGILGSYSFTDWLSVQAGLVLGWDNSTLSNTGPSGTGQIAVTPTKDLPLALNFIVGPEASGTQNPIRWVIDLTGSYTGISNVTLGMNFDYGWQANDVFLTSQGLGNESAKWYGIAAYAAYDFLKDFRASLRQEWFKDAQGVRTGAVGGVTLFSTTLTLQYNVWRGLFARGEFRHDSANQLEFGCRPNTGCSDKTQDTMSVSLYYKFL